MKQLTEHAVRLFEAFQLVNNGPRMAKESITARKQQVGGKGTNHWLGKSDIIWSGGKQGRNNSPLCLWKLHKSRGIRNLLKDYSKCLEQESKQILVELSPERVEDRP